MKQYQELLQRILTEGRARSDRTGTGTVGIFGHQMRFDLSAGFPLVTTKHLHLRSIIHELLWMLSGSTNVHDLQKVGVSIWDEWAKDDGELGPVYGKQWRSWEGKASISYGPGGPELEPGKPVDQIAELVANLKRDPFSRRHVISAWNVSDLKEMALAPCHCLFQFHVEEMTLRERYQWQQRANIETKTSGGPVFLFPVIDGAVAERSLTPEQIAQGHDAIERWYKNTPRLRLNCQLYQRSADVFLGVPFNIASYALLTAMIAQSCGFAPGEFIHTFGDVHIYQNHLEQVRLQLTRAPRALPRLLLNPEARDLFAFKYEDIVIDGYDPHPAIKAPVAV